MTTRELTVVLSLSLLLLPRPSSAQFATDQQRREAWRHYRAGQELMTTEQFAKAAEAFGRAIAQDRLLALAHYAQGQAFMALRRFPSAVRAFTACGAAFHTLHNLAESHRQTAERRWQEEIRELREIARRMTEGRAAQLDARIAQLERRQSDAGTAFEPPAFLSLALGSAYFRIGDLVEAERYWKAAVSADPRFGEAHNNLAALYAMTNRREDAEDAVRAAEDAGFRVNPQLKVDIAGL
jgi:tetratricopeptide (TPR) repeat protein